MLFVISEIWITISFLFFVEVLRSNVKIIWNWSQKIDWCGVYCKRSCSVFKTVCYIISTRLSTRWSIIWPGRKIFIRLFVYDSFVKYYSAFRNRAIRWKKYSTYGRILKISSSRFLPTQWMMNETRYRREEYQNRPFPQTSITLSPIALESLYEIRIHHHQNFFTTRNFALPIFPLISSQARCKLSSD